MRKNMKTIFLFIIMSTTGIAWAQEDKSPKNYEYFIVLYTTGENWDKTKPAHEQLYFKEHSSHLSEMRKAKIVDIGGRYSDTGMILLKAKNETEAQFLIINDSSVQNKIFKADIFPFDMFYKGCVE
jgi:hypothetical protein